MRVLLVESGVTEPGNFVYQCYPPHGLMYIASFIREKAPGTELKIFDMMVERAGPDAIKPVLENYRPHMVAIHAMSFQASCMHKVAENVKKWGPDCFVAVGGPHPSAAPELVLRDNNIDILGQGEGEQTFLEILERLETGEDPAGVPGTMAMRGGEVVSGPDREYISDLDSLPFPAWDLVDLRRYFTDVMLNQNDITYRREVTTIFTSRACPFRCIFCHNMFGKKFRDRSVNNILDEMEILQKEHGITELHIIDDCFNNSAERAESVLRGIIARGLDFKIAFPNGIRGDRLPDSLLDLMSETGVYKANFGIESGSKEVQKIIRKGLSLDRIKDGIERASRRGIFCHGFFMLGFPDETAGQMMETIDFAVHSKLHTAGFALLSPFPGTEVHRMAVEAGHRIEFDPDDTSYQRITVNLTAEDDETLSWMHKRAHWKFYGSPKRLYRILSTMPHPSDIFRVGMAHFRLKFL